MKTEQEITTIADITASLYRSAREPESFEQFIDELGKHGIDFSDYLGDMQNPNDRMRAAGVLRGGQERIVGTMIGGLVNGFIFDPYHEPTVKAIIDIKSLGGKDRKALFPSVINFETFNQLVEKSDRTGINIENLFEKCFIRFPIKNEVVKLIPPELISDIEGKPTIPFFITQSGSPFDVILNNATKDKPIPILGGTSANFSGYGSLTDVWQSAVFCLSMGGFYLYNKGNPNVRGSFPMIRYMNGQLVEERSGNLSFKIINQRAGFS